MMKEITFIELEQVQAEFGDIMGWLFSRTGYSSFKILFGL